MTINSTLHRDDPDYRQAIDFLYERINYERTTEQAYTDQNFRLNRMRELLRFLGDPHLKAPVIHIAGTKGKGSVAWLLAETLRRSGYRVGLYTSPHLIHLEERFVIQGKPCSPCDLVESVNLLRLASEQLTRNHHGAPTFFELTTAISWLLFAANQVDYAVIEVGLGGRLDSTNVCSPALCIITSISLDHQLQLGNTIGRIAGEKAGIIKPNVPVISGATTAEAAAVIEHVAYQNNVRLLQLDRDFTSSWHIESEIVSELCPNATLRRGRMDFTWNHPVFPIHDRSNLQLSMLGEHQSKNAALVCAAVDVLRSDARPIEESALHGALEHTQVPARMEIRSAGPWMIVDSAHNLASIQALAESLQQHFRPRRRIVVFSASRDKDYPSMLRVLAGCFDTIVLTQYHSNQRAVPLDLLSDTCNQIVASGNTSRPTIHAEANPIQALAIAKRESEPLDLICITGSFFLASELIGEIPRDESLFASELGKDLGI